MSRAVQATILAGAILFVAAADAQTDSGQPDVFVEALQQHTITVDSATDPASVPRSIVIRELLRSIESVNVDERDMEVLQGWAREGRELVEEGRRAFEANYTAFCDRLDSDDRPVTELMEETVGLSEEYDAALVASWDAAHRLMSDRGQLEVNSYIENQLSYGMIIDLDHRGWAAQLGERAARDFLQGTCYVMTLSEEEIRQIPGYRDPSAALPGPRGQVPGGEQQGEGGQSTQSPGGAIEVFSD